MLHVLITSGFAALIFLVGLYLWFYFIQPSWTFLRNETFTLGRRRDEVEKLNQQTSSSESPTDGTELVLGNSVALTDRFISDLTGQAKSGLTTVNIAGSLDEVSDQLFERVAWARYFASFAVYIGLVGTIAGLYFALNNLQGATQIHDESTLRTFAQSIRALLGSLQGAFFSAAAGVLGSVVMGCLLQRYDAACGAYVTDLNNFGHRQLLPYLERLRLGLLPTSSVEAARTLVTQLGKTLNGFTKAWSDRFETLAVETANVAASTSKLLDTTKSLESASDTMAESAIALDGSIKELTATAGREMQAVDMSRQAIESATESVRQLADRAASWPDISEKLVSTSESVEAAGEAVRASSEGLGGASSALRLALDGLHEHVRELSDESFEDLSAKLARAIAEVVAQAASQLSQLTEGVRQRDQRIETMVESIGSLIARQDRYLTDVNVAVNSMVGLIPALEDPRPTLDQLLLSLRSVSESIERVASAGSGSPGFPAGTANDGLAGELAQVRNQLTAISQALGSYRELRDDANHKLDLIHGALVDGQRRAGDDAARPRARGLFGLRGRDRDE